MNSDLIHEFDNRPMNYAASSYWDILRLSSESDIAPQRRVAQIHGRPKRRFEPAAGSGFPAGT